MSIRTRLLLTSMVTLAVGLGALILAGNVLLDRRVETETRSLLDGRADAEVAALDVSAGGVRVRETANDAELDRGSWVFQRGRLLERPPAAAPALDRVAVALGRAGRGAEREGPGRTRLLARPLVPARGGPAVGTVVVAVSTGSLESLEGEVLLGSLVLAALVLLAGFFAIRGAIAGALGPVERMTAEAEDWSEHDLDHRFALGAPRDELTGLAATLDGLLARIAASRRHEQRFASEAAHELRTPLARMRGRAELALESGGEEREALQAVVAQTERMNAAIDALMAVARAELDPSGGHVDLAALAAELEGVEVAVAGPLPPAEGDAEIVRRALAPLVENAHRHARSAVRLELSAGEGRVRAVVRDDGPGLGEGDPERFFVPGYRGEGERGDGAGLGLALARRLARSCGGDVVAGAGPGGCFVLELPAIGGAQPVR